MGLGDNACFVGKAAAISTSLIVGVPCAVSLLGFGSAGVAAGSLAAAFQSSFLGGTIAAGGTFATLQSVGAAGLAVTTKVLFGAAGTALATKI